MLPRHAVDVHQSSMECETWLESHTKSQWVAFFSEKLFLSYFFHKVVIVQNIPTSGNALAWMQRVHGLVDLWDITFCTHRF